MINATNTTTIPCQARLFTGHCSKVQYHEFHDMQTILRTGPCSNLTTSPSPYIASTSNPNMASTSNTYEHKIFIKVKVGMHASSLRQQYKVFSFVIYNIYNVIAYRLQWNHRPWVSPITICFMLILQVITSTKVRLSKTPMANSYSMTSSTIVPHTHYSYQSTGSATNEAFTCLYHDYW